MEVVKAFNNELSSLYETRPPISKAKMTSITRSGIKAIKFYKHVVQSVEKFIQKCKPEYKVPGLYVIDSIVRQSRHQFTPEKDVFAPRFARNIQQTFLHLFNCPQEDKGKIVRVLNLWQKNQVFTPDVIQPLLDMASLANKDQLVVQPNSNGVQSSATSQPRTPTTKPSPVKDPSWLTPSVDLNSTGAQAVPTPTLTSKLQPSTVIDPNIMQQLQNLQNLLLDKQLETNSVQSKKEDTVKFDKKLLDFDYDEDDDDPASPQQPTQSAQPPLPSIDSLQTILSNPEVLRQLQTLQQQMSSRQQQAEMEDKMRRLQEMRHQEEEFDKHLAQTLPNLPFASECDFKPSSVSNMSDMTPAPLSAPPQPSQSLTHPDPISGVNFTTPISAPPAPFGVVLGDSDERPSAADFDERNRGPNLTGGLMSSGTNVLSTTVIVSDDTSWESKIGGSTTQQSSLNNDGPIEIIDLIRNDSPVKSPSNNRSNRRRRSPSPRRSSRRSKSRSRSRSRRRRSRTRTRSRSRSRSKSRDRERERERRRRGLPPMKRNHLAVCSTTLWIGHLSKLVQQEELSDTFGEFGDIVSINLIPPRGCAFICMNRRQDASKALQHLRHFKLQGKAITIAWAPGKGMKDKEWKDYWEVEHGVSYIPWNKVSIDTDLDLLEDGGVIDEDSMPDFLKVKRSIIKHEYKQMQQQQHLMKLSEDKDDITKDLKARNDMEIGTVGNPGGPVPPTFIPLPDNSLATTGPPPTAQPPPGIPPPMGILPPFALPPRLLGPMGPMGPLGMGNVPLGVPPPLMMPPPPQQMVGRLPPPFNPPPQMSIMPPPGIPPTDNLDKSKVPQIPPPPTPDTFPDLTSMVNPFGIPLPAIPNFPNANVLTQPPMSQPTHLPISKLPTQPELPLSEPKTELKELKPPSISAIIPETSPSPVGLNESNNNDRSSVKEQDSASSGGSGSDSGGTIGNNNDNSLGPKDCDWRDSSPRRRDRNEREEKRRRRDSPPPQQRRDDRRSVDRRGVVGGPNDDRRSEDRRGGSVGPGSGIDRRGPSSRWQSRQNKWQDDKDGYGNKRSGSPSFSGNGGGRTDKDERPSLLPLPLPDHFNQGGDMHGHFKQQSLMPPHHEEFQQNIPPLGKQSMHHDFMQEQQFQPKPPHHDQHYQQQSSAHDQYHQGPVPPHFREQHDQHFQHTPSIGFGGRFPEPERDDMIGGQNPEYPPPRGFFNRGHPRMPPPRNPRPLLRTPNGPMFGPPRGPPPMGGPPSPMPMRGHRPPGPPGNRMDGPGFMSPRGFPPPGLRGRGGRYPVGGGVGGGRGDDWDGPPSRKRGWDDFPLPGPPGHLVPPGQMGPPPGHMGPPPSHHGHAGPSGHAGLPHRPGPMHLGPKNILGGPRMMPPIQQSNLERRKSRWSTPQDSKSDTHHQDDGEGDGGQDVELNAIENMPESKSNENMDSDVQEMKTELISEQTSQPFVSQSSPCETTPNVQTMFDDVSMYDEEKQTNISFNETPTTISQTTQPYNIEQTRPQQYEQINIHKEESIDTIESFIENTNRRLSFNNNNNNSSSYQQTNKDIEDNAQNLYGDETFTSSEQSLKNNIFNKELIPNIESNNDRSVDNEMKVVETPIFEVEKNLETNPEEQNLQLSNTEE